MKYSFRILAGAALAVIAPLSMAGGHPDVNWSISVGSPYPAPAVVAPPPVIYVQPQPVYVRPRPIYVQPAAVVQYGPTYYVEEVRPPRGKPWKRHHHHHHYDY